MDAVDVEGKITGSMIYSTMIHLFVKVDPKHPAEVALEQLFDIRNAGVTPDLRTCHTALDILSRKSYEVAADPVAAERVIYEFMNGGGAENGCSATAESYALLGRAYARARSSPKNAELAEQVLVRMEVAGLTPVSENLNALLEACVRSPVSLPVLNLGALVICC
jgi:hypothetical protein